MNRMNDSLWGRLVELHPLCAGDVVLVHNAERVAFLGTGIMGASMARNLLKAGCQVRVWNRTLDKARDERLDRGAR
jgi:glutamyl-tRNA reductase